MPIDVTKPGGAERIAKTAALARDLVLGDAVPTQTFALTPAAPGTVEAPLAVGNLAVLATLLGTPFEPQWDGVILCLEDICEYFYALDRHFVHLAQSRAGRGVAGIVLGDFTDLEDNEIPWGESVLEMAARHFPGVPVAEGLPIGHAERNVPLLQGARAQLDVTDEAGSLTVSV